MNGKVDDEPYITKMNETYKNMTTSKRDAICQYFNLTKGQLELLITVVEEE
jgi:hypothetical protein